MTITTSFELTLPAAVAARLDSAPPRDASDTERIAWLCELGHINITHGGGPFCAGVWNAAGDVVAVGVNVVMPQMCSSAHAELLALSLA